MRVDGTLYRTIWLAEDGHTVRIIDQTLLPHIFKTVELTSVEEAARAIKDMLVRGAPLIGATGAYGMALAMHEDPSDENISAASHKLAATRPTASNLAWALKDLSALLVDTLKDEREKVAYQRAAKICDEDVRTCESIGNHGAKILTEHWQKKGNSDPINILTHCNAGWLATVDWGTALAPIYKAHENGVPIHVWVDETRPRNQGASLTSWELAEHGVPHTLIVDNAGGHLMQQNKVDLCIVGTDRTTASGDVCNKVGTYLKALAANANDVPFFVALPHSTIDWDLRNNSEDIPIEIRDAREVTHVSGKGLNGEVTEIQLTPDKTEALNIAFDVTPARYITGLITERGVCSASASGLLSLYPEKKI